jgi:hypothetical protein
LRNRARSRSTSLRWINTFLSSNGNSGLLIIAHVPIECRI